MELSTPVQQALNLHLFLYDRPLHPELFRHYADHRVRQGRYQADVWIVGLSHVATISCGHYSLTELVAPESDVLPTRGVLARFRMKGERDLERETSQDWNYMVSSQVETMNETLYKSVHNDLVRHATRRGWYQPHPEWSDGDLEPFSFVDHEARDREFHVHAFHAFPQELTIVKTQSIFELPA